MISLNTQEPEKAVGWDPDDSILDLIDIFYTIQGEGPFAGMPCVFVRLAGCNLKCPTCDTNYTLGRQKSKIDEVVIAVDMIRDQHKMVRLVVITGGEPLRQHNTIKLCRNLIEESYIVQIETNGTYPFPTPYIAGTLKRYVENQELVVVCSPKAGSISPGLVPYINSYKYVMHADYVDETDGLPTIALGGIRPGRPVPFGVLNRPFIFLNPEDSFEPDQNKRNLDACAKSCLQFGYRLGVQMHKACGLP